MPANTIHHFAVDDRVVFPPDALVKPSLIGVVFKVEEVPSGRKTSYRVRAENGGPLYRVRPGEMIPAPEGTDALPVGTRPFVPIEYFDAGAIVTISNGARKGIGPDDPYVVTKDSGRDNVNIAKLGGDKGNAWRWPRSALVKRDVAWLTERLVEMA